MAPTTRATTASNGPIATDIVDLCATTPRTSAAGPTRKRRRVLSGKSQANIVMNHTQASSRGGEIGSESDELDDLSPSHGSHGDASISKLQDLEPTITHAVLKGRKRFSADFADVKEQSKIGFEVHGLSVQGFRAGDDEGSMEFRILKCGSAEPHITSVNLLVSDTSEYPDHHTYFAFSPDQGLVPPIQRVIEDVSSGPSLPIREALQKLLSAFSRAIESKPHPQGAQDTQEVIEINSDSDPDEDEDEDYDPYVDDDDFDGMGIPGDNALATTKSISRLKRDFIEAVATGYRPGHISFGIDDFVLSISIPVVTLASSISPRALMAWDRRLMSRNQHLTLLISGLRGTYPPVEADGSYTQTALWRGVSLQFKVGLTRSYKPSKNEAAETCRTFGMIIPDAEDELRKEAEVLKDDNYMVDAMEARPHSFDDHDDESHFDKFSLSSSLESLLDQALLRLIQLRRKFSLGWAGAEMLLAEVEKSQNLPENILATKNQEIKAADLAEAKFGYNLPPDPLNIDDRANMNFPLTAFCYLLRRVTLCNLYCLVCHNLINKDFIAIKPYVCDSKLCAYQYYSLNRGPSLEYEIISNPEVVDLLVSIAYVAAAEGVLDEPLPVGMALRVKVPDASTLVNQNPSSTNAWGLPFATPTTATPGDAKEVMADADGMCDFDDLDIRQMRAVIVALIDSLPSIDDMKRHLERRVKSGKSKPKLKDLDPTISPAAWSILRWCVASCTAYLEETSEEERIPSIGAGWKQFRFSVGAPDAEAKFNLAVATARQNNPNAMTYPTLYAFHGSPLRNWHSIIRHGLWYRTVTHGRAYGDGVYLAKDGSVSMGYYATPSTSVWRNSKSQPTSCVAVAEIVNLPHQFQSCNPYYVIKDTHWIMCRYLLVKGKSIEEALVNEQKYSGIPFVKHDPAHPVVLNGQKLNIPDPSYCLENLLAARQSEYIDEDPDEEDVAIFQAADVPSQSQSQPKVPSGASPKKAKDDWKHNAKWVRDSTEHLMPPPLESTPAAAMAVQRELRAILKEQESAPSLADLGWCMPLEFMGDNLFQWIVELHSFDRDLPIAKDMKAKNVNSIIFEIRFPPAFPIAPPFFRIIRPRFLPFIQGGGGHVTGGGSICMDLLTADGWLPSYSIAAILLQIRLAISNLDPRPARLARNWDTPYGVHEALEGYKRAASAHGWKIPQGLDQLVR